MPGQAGRYACCPGGGRSAHADRIAYHLLDATDEAALLALGEGRFDAALPRLAIPQKSLSRPTLAADYNPRLAENMRFLAVCAIARNAGLWSSESA